MITGLRKMTDHWVKEDVIAGLRKMSDHWVKEDE